MTEAKQATPYLQLIDELMDSRVPKTEREHAAAREIERLRVALSKASVKNAEEPVGWFGYSHRIGGWFQTYQGEDDSIPLFSHPPRQEPQEPIAYVTGYHDGYPVAKAVDETRLLPVGMAFYDTPCREWVWLTDKEIARIGSLDWDSNYFGIWYAFARAIEAKLKEKNS